MRYLLSIIPVLLLSLPACASPPAPSACGAHPAPCVVIGGDQLQQVAQAIALARDTKINAAKADDALLQQMQAEVNPQIKKPDDKPPAPPTKK